MGPQTRVTARAVRRGRLLVAAGVLTLLAVATPPARGTVAAATGQFCVISLLGSCVAAVPSPTSTPAAPLAPSACVATLLSICVGGSNGPITVGPVAPVSPLPLPSLPVPTPALPVPTPAPACLPGLVCICPGGAAVVAGACPAASTGPTLTATPTPSALPGAPLVPAAAPPSDTAAGTPVGTSLAGGALVNPTVPALQASPTSIAPAVLSGALVTSTRPLGALAGLDLGDLRLWPIVAVLDILALGLLVALLRRSGSPRTDP